MIVFKLLFTLKCSKWSKLNYLRKLEGLSKRWWCWLISILSKNKSKMSNLTESFHLVWKMKIWLRLMSRYICVQNGPYIRYSNISWSWWSLDKTTSNSKWFNHPKMACNSKRQTMIFVTFYLTLDFYSEGVHNSNGSFSKHFWKLKDKIK